MTKCFKKPRAAGELLRAGRLGICLLAAWKALAIATLFVGFSASGADLTQPEPSLVTPSPSLSLRYDPEMLLAEFQKAQTDQFHAFLRKEAAALQKLKSTQAAEQKEFEQKEREARHKFFADQSQGADRRAYMKAFLVRRDAFRKQQSDERARAKNEADLRTEALRDEQARNLEKFRESLSRKERPADNLWPQPGF